MEGNLQDYRKGLVEKIGEKKVLLLEASKYQENKLSIYEEEPAELKEKRFLDALPLDRYVLRHPETVSAGMAA